MDDVSVIFNTIDVDSSGSITYNEFKAWFLQVTRSLSVTSSTSFGISRQSSDNTGFESADSADPTTAQEQLSSLNLGSTTEK